MLKCSLTLVPPISRFERVWCVNYRHPVSGRLYFFDFTAISQDYSGLLWTIRDHSGLPRNIRDHPGVTQAAQGQATCYTSSPSTGNQLYSQPKHRQLVLYAAQAQATSYTCSPSTSNQLYLQPKHGQPVIQATQAQATSYTSRTQA